MQGSKLFMVVLLGLLSISGQAQRKLPTITAENPSPGRDTAHEPDQDAHQDLFRELEIKRAEGTYKQNIERAKESAQLSIELRDTYAQQKALNPAELKKLARLEKLTRQLRSAAGGGDDDEQLKDPPNNMQCALERMADLATELRTAVEKTPRQVVSVSLIIQANELLELISLARSFNK